MALMKISHYRTQYFMKGSYPALRTIRNWINTGQVYGEIINGHYYVDPEKLAPAISVLVNKVLAQACTTNDEKSDNQENVIVAVNELAYKVLIDTPHLAKRVLPPKTR